MEAPNFPPLPVSPMVPYAEIITALRQNGLVRSASPVIEPLTGGVSSDIIKIVDGDRCLVVKRALAKLKVKDDWFADTGRNNVEQLFLQRVGAMVPHAVPRLLFADASAGWFAMEYLGGELQNWKTALLRGDATPEHAKQAGELLGTIHRETWGRPAVAREFSTWRNFHQLRVEPYLETSARRVPDLAPWLLAEAASLGQTALALVHGDFSPKNMLVAPGRLVLLDAEVAWYGDPAFDLAFFLTHLHLKGLYHAASPKPYLDLANTFWAAYVAALGATADAELEARTVRLTLCLLLARVHGKSPVEYLTEPHQRDTVTAFVHRHLPRPPMRVADLTSAWLSALPPQ